MLKPEEIRNEQFELSVLGGYKREQVDAFFASVLSDYEKLYSENAELVQKLKLCVEKIEEYQKDEQFLKSAIINAEKLNETSLRNIEAKEKEIELAAREKAESIIEKAQLEAENIEKTAKLKAADSIKQCEIETAAKISELKSAQEGEERHLNDLKKEVSDFKDMILKLYEKHLSSLSKLPSYELKVKEQPKPVEPVVEDKAEETVEQPVVETISETDLSDEPQKTELEVTEEQPPVAEQPHGSTEKTAEFVLEKSTQNKSTDNDDFERNFKFQGLKFGTDFDIKKEK